MLPNYHWQHVKLYSFTAQIDNSINAKIAVSSARDSSAMKTLALVTTVFLPGTYIAVSWNFQDHQSLRSDWRYKTLFSMSMFDWSSSSKSTAQSDTPETVSRKFWIYWVVTIPLTLLVMVLWRAWWLWQERLYNKEVSEAVEGVMDDGTAAFSLQMPGHNKAEAETKPRRHARGRMETRLQLRSRRVL